MANQSSVVSLKSLEGFWSAYAGVNPRSRAKLKGYVCNRCCQLQVSRAYSSGCWRCSDIPVIGNIIASLIGSTVIKFLAIVAYVGGLVISPFLLMPQVTKLG